ncbi:MAG: ABC transporter permease [Planctomycetia bacterium]|nr:ABC transporter permease [Planctomycetia bacterium]
MNRIDATLAEPSESQTSSEPAQADRSSSQAETPPEPLVTRITPAGGWRLVDLGELWRYRELLFFLIWRDVKVRYRQTVLGVAWAILQPVLMVAVFTVFFGRLAGLPSAGIPYPLFALAGLLPWMFFAASVSTAGNSVVQSERLVTKIYFPRLAIPFAAVGVAAVDFCIAFGVLGVLMAWYGVWPGIQFLLVIPIALVIGLAGLAFGTGLAALNVRYRDFRYVIPFLVQFWMFATPTVYMQPPADASGVMSVLMWANPMTGLIGGFRSACLGLPIPWAQLAVSSAVIVAVAVVSMAYFRKVEDDFADII